MNGKQQIAGHTAHSREWMTPNQSRSLPTTHEAHLVSCTGREHEDWPPQRQRPESLTRSVRAILPQKLHEHTSAALAIHRDRNVPTVGLVHIAAHLGAHQLRYFSRASAAVSLIKTSNNARKHTDAWIPNTALQRPRCALGARNNATCASIPTLTKATARVPIKD